MHGQSLPLFYHPRKLLNRNQPQARRNEARGQIWPTGKSFHMLGLEQGYPTLWGLWAYLDCSESALAYRVN